MKKLGKSITGTGLALVLSLAVSMTAFATGSSPEKNGIVTNITGATDKNGNSVAIDILEIPEESKAAVEVVKKPETMKQLIQDLIQGIKDGLINVKDEIKEEIKELEDIKPENLELLDVREVKISGDPSLVEFPIEITFEVPGVLESSKVAVLHYVDGAWQIEKAFPGKGTITATFDSLSPVAFIVDKTTVASSATSPKTGVEHTVPVAVAIVAVTAVGVFIVRKKKSIN